MNIHLAALGLGILFLSACAPDQNILDRGVAIAMNEPASESRPAGQFPPRFAALVADTNVPALILTVESRSQTGRLLMESRINGVETWLSSDLTGLMLENGMLQGTRGLGSELFSAELSEPMALILSGRSGYSDRLHSYLNGNVEIVTRSYRCLVEVEGNAVIPLEIGNVSTRVMTEDCKSLDQSFRNTYWVNSNSGAIVQARQWAGGKLGYLKTQAATRSSAPTPASQEVVVGL
tara:strand:+ start:2452 stop:3156 length:705 start_codon:yes stop_codon:yes gene_type:complete